MKKIIYIVVAVILVVLAGFKLQDNREEQKEQTAIVAKKNAFITVRVDTVKSQTMLLKERVNGNFAPMQNLQLASERGGQVVKVLVDEGAKVQIGQTLAVIKDDLYSVELNNAEAAYKTALKNVERFESAYKTGGVTQQQVDQVQLQLESAQARLKQAKINMSDSRIQSTINGIVNKRFIEPGTVVAPGTPLFEIVNVSKLKLKVKVTEGEVARIEVGDTVTIKASVYPNKDFHGKITFIAPMANESLSFPVEIEVFNNSANDLRAGMYGSVIFSNKGEELRPVTVVPREAFIGSVQNNEVFVVRDEKAQLTEIVSGRIYGEQVEVLEGLKPGDIVVTGGIINLSDGAKVKLAE